MKKLMFAIGAVALCGAALAVESSIVGYATSKSVPLQDKKTVGYYIGSVAFEGIGKDSMVAVKDIGTPSAPAVESGDDNCVELQFLNPKGTSYISYYYISDAENEEEELVTAWADKFDAVAEDEYPIGQSFWYMANGEPSSITMPGQVNDSDTVTKDLDIEYRLFGNAWPMALDLTKVTTTVPALESGEEGVLELQVLNAKGTSYITYCYISDAENEKGELVTAWADGSDYAVTEPVAAVGAGAWIRNTAEKPVEGYHKITFNK